MRIVLAEYSGTFTVWLAAVCGLIQYRKTFPSIFQPARFYSLQLPQNSDMELWKTLHDRSMDNKAQNLSRKWSKKESGTVTGIHNEEAYLKIIVALR